MFNSTQFWDRFLSRREIFRGPYADFSRAHFLFDLAIFWGWSALADFNATFEGQAIFHRNTVRFVSGVSTGFHLTADRASWVHASMATPTSRRPCFRGPSVFVPQSFMPFTSQKQRRAKCGSSAMTWTCLDAPMTESRSTGFSSSIFRTASLVFTPITASPMSSLKKCEESWF